MTMILQRDNNDKDSQEGQANGQLSFDRSYSNKLESTFWIV